MAPVAANIIARETKHPSPHTKILVSTNRNDLVGRIMQAIHTATGVFLLCLCSALAFQTNVARISSQRCDKATLLRSARFPAPVRTRLRFPGTPQPLKPEKLFPTERDRRAYNELIDELNTALAPLQLDAEDSWKDIAKQVVEAKAAVDPQDELARLKVQSLGDYALELHVLKTIAERFGTVDISRLSPVIFHRIMFEYQPHLTDVYRALLQESNIGELREIPVMASQSLAVGTTSNFTTEASAWMQRLNPLTINIRLDPYYKRLYRPPKLLYLLGTALAFGTLGAASTVSPDLAPVLSAVGATLNGYLMLTPRSQTLSFRTNNIALTPRSLVTAAVLTGLGFTVGSSLGLLLQQIPVLPNDTLDGKSVLMNLGRIVGSWLTSCFFHPHETQKPTHRTNQEQLDQSTQTGQELSKATPVDDKYKDLPEHVRRRREEADKLMKHPAMKRLMRDDIYTEKIKAFNLAYAKLADVVYMDSPPLDIDADHVDLTLRKRPPGSNERDTFMARLFRNVEGSDPLEDQRAQARRAVLLVDRVYTRSPWLMVREVHHIALNAAVRELTQARSLSEHEVAQLQHITKGIRTLIDNDEMRVDPFQKAPLAQKISMLRSMIEHEMMRLPVAHKLSQGDF